MSIDYNKLTEYVNLVKTVEDELKKHQELFDNDKMIEFKQVTKGLEQNIETIKNDSRKLSIGIIGAVKAGKSSFLNVCIFDGEEYLPKAATPMTAALTKITYSDNPKAIIHFYTKEDWETIKEQSADYDEELKKKYNEYIDKNKDKAKDQYKEENDNDEPTKGIKEKISSFKNNIKKISPFTSLMSFEEFEKSYKCQSEYLRGAKELTRMAMDPTLMNKLGGTDEIEGDIILKLNDYVGSNGHHTPIVSYVDLQVDNKYIKDLEIVDTPGLNDPVVSRGQCSKKFLEKCDVVLLLSPCSQFMDAQTVNLMAKNLPNAGVREILIVGSKLDSGILNESSDSFGVAYKKSLDSYKKQFLRTLSEVKKSGKNMGILDKMSPEKILFVSSICFTIDQKIKNNSPLDDNEKKVYENLHKYKDFDDKYLFSLGGIKNVRDALKEVLTRKKEITEGKNNSLLDNTKNSHLRILEEILQEIGSRKIRLETASVEKLNQESNTISDIIDSSRTKLIHIFEGAAIKCEEKVKHILPQLTIEMGQHYTLKIESKTHDDYITKKTGLFGWKRENYPILITDNSAEVSDVIKNILQYHAKCSILVNKEFGNFFDKGEFARKIKDVVLRAFAQKEFDEDMILLPLHNVLDKISIPNIGVDVNDYIDEINTRFKNDYAKNEEIHQLKNIQSSLLSDIAVKMSDQLVNALNYITKILNDQATNFADTMNNELQADIEKLQKQAKEKERYIEENKRFTENIHIMKTKIKM